MQGTLERQSTGWLMNKNGKSYMFESFSADPLDITVVPHDKPFPETWDIMVGAFHPNLFMSLEKKEDIKGVVDDVYQKATQTENCGVFNYISDMKLDIHDFFREDNNFSYFLFPIDQSDEIGAIGVMHLSDFFLLETVMTQEIHFCVKVEWRCSFSNFPDIKDKLSEKKKQGYDIRVGKYMQIELMNLMRSLLKDKSKRDQMQLNFQGIDLEDEETWDRITKISVFSCSLNDAFQQHVANGAHVVSGENKSFYRAVGDGKSLSDIHYTCDPFSKYGIENGPGLRFVYWNNNV